MKKHLIVAAGLATLSTSAFASMARMSALNQSTDGSYYMNDNRNVFRDASHVNSLGHMFTAEYGTSQRDGAAGTATATTEGGYFTSNNNWNYGFYLNGSVHGNVAGVNNDGNGANGTEIDPGRLDFFLGSNTNHNWGLRLGYSSVTVDGLDASGSGFDLGVGGTIGGANVWLNYAPSVTTDRNAIGGGNVENNADMNIGFNYDMGNYTLFAEYDSEGNAGTADEATTFRVGAGWTHDVDGGVLFYDVSLQSSDNQDGNDALDDGVTNVPVTFGAEIKANSWLSWRLSIQQSLFQSASDAGTAARDTTLGAGASLTWGNVLVDGTITNAAAGSLGTDNFLSNVSLSYSF